MSGVVGVILAAGSSRRLGEPKQFAKLGAETLLERAVRVALESALAQVFVVTSADLQSLVIKRDRCTMLINEAVSEGMASSIRIGVNAAIKAGAVGIVVMACDQPAVTASHLRDLLGGDEVVASSYAGRRGVPAYFPASTFAALLELRGDVGARELLQSARSLPLEGGELDIDTVEDLEEARSWFTSKT